MAQKKTWSKNIDFDSPDVWEFIAPFFVVVGCTSVFLHVPVRPASCIRVFVWLCKLHAIEDHVLCHATVVRSINILKVEEYPLLRVVLYWRVFQCYTAHAGILILVCVDNLAQ